MKIDILSDIHLDMWHDPETALTACKKKILFSKVLPKTPGEVLVIAGDLGHYNKQNLDLLKWFQEEYGYQILYVWGNHDYYRVNIEQEQEYINSIAKAEELRHMINEQKGMYHLDGEIVEIDGIKFGGCNGWYDGSLYEGDDDETDAFWYVWMNDCRIKPFGNTLRYDTLHKLDLPKIEALYQSCDVMITHTCPIASERIFEKMYGEFHPLRAFYCFDGEKYLKDGTMKYWVFGHTHVAYEEEYFGKKIICNAMGRPTRRTPNPKISSKQIEIK
jgi:predicted phosphodiesterase